MSQMKMIQMFNHGAERIFDYSAEEVMGRPLDILMPKRFHRNHRKHVEGFERCKDNYQFMDQRDEIVGIKKDGTEFPASASVSKLEVKGEKIFTVMLQDVTERKQTDATLRQLQKIKAIGQLTGGIAHDFNNLLHIITGNLDMLDEDLRQDIGAQKMIQAAKRAAFRGGELTKQLLAFSRQQELHPEIVPVNNVINDTLKLLERTLGEDIMIRTAFDDRLRPINIDHGMLGNAILNLAINARDAMPKGGELRFETANVDLKQEVLGEGGATVSGPYVLITVSDTGTGMNAETLNRVFEPFFTTKEVGKGSGMGLSMVYGFVTQSGGHVRVDSREGKGTSVRLYFTAADEIPAGAKGAEEKTEPVAKGDETILVVEDNEAVRQVTVAMLGRKLCFCASLP